MSKKIKYVPPAAELIQLAPCEKLAAWDWKFGNTWRDPGYYEPGKIGPTSAVVVLGTFDPTKEYESDAGFTMIS